MADNNKELENARKLSRQLSIKLERQTKTMEETRGSLAAVEAYIRGLEKTNK